MATPPNLTQLAFAAGLDESTQDEILDPSNGFALLQNVRQDRRGAVNKRLGYEWLSPTHTNTRQDSTVRSQGNRLFAHNGAPCVIDGTYLDLSAGLLATVGRVPEVGCSAFGIPALGVASSSGVADVVYCNGYIALAHYSSTAIGSTTYAHVSLVDAETMQLVSGPTLVVQGTTVEHIALGTYGAYVILITPGTSSNTITAHYLNTSSATTIAAGWVAFGAALATDWTLTVAVSSMSDRIAIAYGNTSGGASQVTVKTFDITGVLQSTTINTSSATPDAVGIGGSKTSTLWVAWNQNTTVKACGLNPTSIGSTTATTATVISAPATPETIHVVEWYEAYPVIGSIGAIYVSATPATGPVLVSRSMVVGAGATVATGTSEPMYGTYGASRPFVYGNRVYGAVFSGSDVVFADVTPNGLSAATWFSRPIAAPVAPGLFAGFLPTCQVALDGNGKAFSVLHELRSAAVTVPLGVCLDFEDPYRWRPVSHNGLTVLSGGIVTAFDGAELAEVNFCFRPAKPTTSMVSGSETTTLGGWRYVLVFEAIDTTGNWIQSGVSDPSDVTGNFSSKSIVVAIQPLAVTMRTRSSTRVAIYRTKDGGEAPYFRVDVVANDPNNPLTYTDGTSDATLATQPTLYGTGNLPGTNGAGQDRRASPFATDIASYNGMLVVASGADLWWSGQTVGGEGTWFNPAFVQPVDGAVKLTALAVQDGTLYAFARRTIFAVAGEAPADNGSSGGLGTPRRLACDVGCINPNSVVVTSAGIFFQSERGIDILTRGGAVMWIGQPVMGTMTSYPVVSSAVLDDRNALVRFSLAPSTIGGRVSGEGRDIVYDLTLNQWQSVDDKTGGTAHEASQDAAQCYIAGGWRYAWLGTDGNVHYERDEDDASACLDGTTWVTMASEFASFKTGGIQGKQFLNNVLVLARKTTDHDLSMSLAYNYEASFRTARTWTRADIDGLLSDGWPITQLKHSPHDDNECQGVRVRIEDATPTGGTVGNGKGATWIALTLDITPKPGVFDVPEEAT